MCLTQSDLHLVSLVSQGLPGLEEGGGDKWLLLRSPGVCVGGAGKHSEACYVRGP